MLILFIVKWWFEYLTIQINFYSCSHKIGQKNSLLLSVSVSNCWVGQSQPKLFGRKSIVGRYNIPVSWFHKAALLAPKETVRSARCSTVPATASERKEGIKMQTQINGMVGKLYLSKAVKSEKIKLKSLRASYLRVTWVTKTLLNTQVLQELKKFDVCNESQMIQEKILHIWIHREGRRKQKWKNVNCW